MSAGLWLLAGAALLVLLIVLEGKRQERKYGPASGRSAVGAGLLELQRILEPERKVEIIQEQREQVDEDEAGDPPVPGRR